MDEIMKFSCKGLALMAIIIFGYVGCATTSTEKAIKKAGTIPAWISDKDSSYSPDKYLAELGEGDSLNGARSNAAGAIAQVFRTKITVDSNIRTRYTEITGEGDDILDMVLRTDVDQTIAQSAEESLFNLQFGESWQDSMGKVYVIAYLDRDETGNLYRQRILDNDKRVMELIDRARSQKEALRRYAFLDAAVVMAEVTAALTEQLEIINMPLSRTVLHSYDIGKLKAEKADQAAALKILIEAANDDDNRIKTVLIDWVTDKGFSVADDGYMYLAAFVKIEPVELNNEYINFNWELNLNLLDSTGVPTVTLSKQERSSGINESTALTRVYQDMTNYVYKDFDNEFLKYLSSFLEK